MSNIFSYSQLQDEVGANAERLAFIDFKLRFTGLIRRSDMKEAFGLAEAAASRMLTQYSELRPDNFYYDRPKKVNVLNLDLYKPLIPIDAETGLGMLAHGFNKNKLIDKPILPYMRIGRIANSLDVKDVSIISRAIYGEYAIECNYISGSSSNHDKRCIVPLALLHDGKNWIFRGYDRSDQKKDSKFKNFNFSRATAISKVEGDDGVQRVYESLNEDPKWTKPLPILLELHPELTNEQKKTVRQDFGMLPDKNELVLTESAAVVWILTKIWNIDTGLSDSKKEDEKEKPFYKFELKNKEMIQPYL